MRGIWPKGEDHVTDNRALKQAIRRRMEQTGEKYTQARRAVLDRTTGRQPLHAARMPLHVQEAERLGHNYLGCEHLLLGVLADERDPAAQVLVAHGVTLEAARRRIAEIAGEGPQDAMRWSYSPRATVVSKLAEVEAERLGEPGQLHPRPGHTLLALITEGEGVPNALFKELGVDVGKLREDLVEALGVPDDMRQIYLRQRAASDEQARQRRGAQ